MGLEYLFLVHDPCVFPAFYWRECDVAFYSVYPLKKVVWLLGLEK